MNGVRVDFGKLDWQAHSRGVRFKAAALDDRQLRLVEIDPDVEQEWCVTGHVGYVLEGELEIEFQEGSGRFAAGDGFFIRDGDAERHKPRAVGSVVRLLLVEQRIR